MYFSDRHFLHLIGQELNQADISVLRKAELKDRFARVRKAFDDGNKLLEKLASKTVSESESDVQWLTRVRRR